MRKIAQTIPFLVIVGGLVLLAVQYAPAQNRRPATPAAEEAPATIADPAWAEYHGRSFEVERDLEKSLYLTAVQIVELAEQQGNAALAIPALESIAIKAPTQAVKNSIRRLIADIAMDAGDTDAADAVLKKMVDETLSQF